MRIGIDLDNTLAGYNRVFKSVAQQLNLVDSESLNTKTAIKKFLLESAGNGMENWKKLQGQVYGPNMHLAELLPGAASFLKKCADLKHEVFVISHKTQYGHYDQSRTNLHQVALSWMNQQGFFDTDNFSIPKDHISFHPTRDDKIDQINQLKLDWFIDDLEEVLDHPGFAEDIKQILYSSAPASVTSKKWVKCSHWDQISTLIFQAELSPDSKALLDRLLAKIHADSANKIEAITGGRNNRIYRIDLPDNKKVIFKHYLNSDQDHVDRANRETKALTLFAEQNELATSRLLAKDESYTGILTTYISESESITEIKGSDILQLVDFIGRLHSYSRNQDKTAFPMAKEACLSTSELIKQVDEKIIRLDKYASSHSELAEFLQKKLIPSLSEASEIATSSQNPGLSIDSELPFEDWILSPSDLGFHNCVINSQGKLYFLDFEYFGWDNPLKLVIDTMMHPGSNMNVALRQDFLHRVIPLFAQHDCLFGHKINSLIPLYTLRWCAIMLNCFLPEHKQRLRFTNTSDTAVYRGKQLLKSKKHFDTFFQLTVKTNDK